MSSWKDLFEIVDYNQKARQKCRECGVVLDVRAGRAAKHALSHGVTGEGAGTNRDSEPGPDKEAPSSTPKGPAKGSREWAVLMVQDIADDKGASPEQKLKALDLLKDFEGFESAGTFDDEVEREKHMEQWQRAVERCKSLREVLKKLVKDPTVKFDIERDLQESA